MLRTLVRFRNLKARSDTRIGSPGSLTDFEAYLGGDKYPRKGGKDNAPVRHGVRSSGRPSIAPGILRNRGREDQELFAITRQHESAIEQVGERGGGVLPGKDRARNLLQRSSQMPQPGDYVEKLNVSPGSADVGVVLPLPQSIDYAANSILIVTGTGSLALWSANDIVLCVPQFASHDVAVKAKPTFVPIDPDKKQSSDVMQLEFDSTMMEKFDRDVFAARSEICARTRVLLRQTERQQQLMSPHFGTALLLQQRGEMISSDPQVTAAEMAKFLLRGQGRSEEEAEKQSRQPSNVLAVHRLMVANTDTFVFDEVSHRITNTYALRRQDELAAVRRVFRWVTQWVDKDKPGTEGIKIIDDFCTKAREIVASRRSYAAQGKDLFGKPQVRQETQGKLSWDKNDRDILTFLRISISSRRRMQSTDIFGSHAIHIAKGCGYVDSVPVDQIETGILLHGMDEPNLMRVRYLWQLLTDLGVMAPWEDAANLQIHHSLAASIKEHSHDQRAVQDNLDEALREDFSTPVYVIDDATATELDDGISVERTSDDDVVWLHTHIADPTIGIQPEDALSELVRKQHSTMYLVAQRYDLLPASFASHYGLKDTHDGQKECNALRFSAKVKISDGSTLDMAVGLSQLKDVRVITYDAATDMLHNAPSADSKEKSTQDDLRLLSRVARALGQRRLLHNSGIAFNVGNADLSVMEKDLPLSPLLVPSGSMDTSAHFLGFPCITLTGKSGPDIVHSGTESKSLVAEMMILSGRVAGAWLANHGLSAYYRTQDAPDDAAIARVAAIRKSREPLSHSEFLQASVNLQNSLLSPNPGEHFALGIDTAAAHAAARQPGAIDVLTGGGYVRASSPLRRYADLAMHWQIKNALRGHKSPVFSQQEIVTEIPRQLRMDTMIKSLQRLSTNHWVALALQRAQLYREMVSSGSLAPTPELDEKHASPMHILDGVHNAIVVLPDIRVSHNLEERVRVQLSDAGFQALCVWDSETMGRPIAGLELKVRMKPVRSTGLTDSLLVEPFRK